MAARCESGMLSLPLCPATVMSTGVNCPSLVAGRVRPISIDGRHFTRLLWQRCLHAQQRQRPPIREHGPPGEPNQHLHILKRLFFTQCHRSAPVLNYTI